MHRLNRKLLATSDDVQGCHMHARESMRPDRAGIDRMRRLPFRTSEAKACFDSRPNRETGNRFPAGVYTIGFQLNVAGLFGFLRRR